MSCHIRVDVLASSHGTCVKRDCACIYVTRHDAGTESLSHQSLRGGFGFVLLLFWIATIFATSEEGKRIYLATLALFGRTTAAASRLWWGST